MNKVIYITNKKYFTNLFYFRAKTELLMISAHSTMMMERLACYSDPIGAPESLIKKSRHIFN